MTLLIISFLAGLLTVLAPCILPVLPVVIGASATSRSRTTPFVVIGSLALSILVFTYILKASTLFIETPPAVWAYVSGGILSIFGLILLVPNLWEQLPGLGHWSGRTNKLLGVGYRKHNFWGDVLIGAALGPVFSTCSPTYFVILANVLPVNFALGSVYLVAYIVGLILPLLLIALLGQGITNWLTAISDSHGWFKRSLGFLFVIIGLAVMFGLDRWFELWILEAGVFDITTLEYTLLKFLP